MSEIIDLAIRREVRVKLLADVHAELKILAYKKHVKISNIVEELITRLVEGDPYLQQLIDDLSTRIRQAKIRALTTIEADTLFDSIEDISTLSEKDDNDV